MSMQDAGLPTSLIVEGKRKNLGGHIIVDPKSFRAKTCNNLVLDQDNNLYQITMSIMTWSLKKKCVDFIGRSWNYSVKCGRRYTKLVQTLEF